jgi:hypothetical protein
VGVVILLRALQAGTSTMGILYTSNRAFPRSRKNPDPLIQAIHAWLLDGPPEAPLTEDWLLSPEVGQPEITQRDLRSGRTCQYTSTKAVEDLHGRAREVFRPGLGA